MTPERIVGIGFVVLLHIVAIGAIMSGLTPNIIAAIEQPIHLIPVPTHDNPPPRPIKIPEVKLTTPSQAVRPPPIDIQNDAAPLVPLAPPQPLPQRPGTVADTALSGIAGTHTIPPYPLAAIRMNEEGRVLLHLAVAEDGSVSSATVTQSSGFTDLDRSAVSWVLAHWRYRPAIRGGVAVASATDAVVVFSLKNAR